MTERAVRYAIRFSHYGDYVNSRYDPEQNKCIWDSRKFICYLWRSTGGSSKDFADAYLYPNLKSAKKNLKKMTNYPDAKLFQVYVNLDDEVEI